MNLVEPPGCERDEVGHGDGTVSVGVGDGGRPGRVDVGEAVHVAAQQPEEGLADDAAPHGPEAGAAGGELGLLEDVEPQRGRVRGAEVAAGEHLGFEVAGDVLARGQLQRLTALEVAQRQRGAGAGEVEQGGDEARVDEPAGLGCGAAGGEEQRPVDGPAAGQAAAAPEVVERADRVTGGEDGQLGHRRVEVVDAAHLAVAEPERGGGELDGDVGPGLGPVVPQVEIGGCRVVELGGQVGADDAGQVVLHHDPLVVPAGEPLGLDELPVGVAAGVGGVVDEAVVEPGEQQVQLADDDVLVVARIADERDLLAVSGQVVDAVGVGADEQLALVIPVVLERFVAGPGPVERVEVEAGSPEAGEAVGVVKPVEAGDRVEGDVVIDELAEVGVAGGDGGVVERLGGAAPAAGLVGLAHLGGEGVKLVERVGERRRQASEHAPEPALEQGGPGDAAAAATVGSMDLHGYLR